MKVVGRRTKITSVIKVVTGVLAMFAGGTGSLPIDPNELSELGEAGVRLLDAFVVFLGLFSGVLSGLQGYFLADKVERHGNGKIRGPR